MAEKWKCLTSDERNIYESRVLEANETPLEVMSMKEGKEIMLRIAKCHPSDVSHFVVTLYSVISNICANFSGK